MKIRNFFDSIMPPRNWHLTVVVTLGIFFGLGFLVFHIGNGTSYLSDNPATCINCHVMTAQYVTWARSSHARVASCNDCHVPHNNIVNTYLFKAQDGLRHSTIFTMRAEPEVIRIKEAGINVVEENCIRCHQHQVFKTKIRHAVTLDERTNNNGRFCWDCHRETPHGRVTSLSSFPYARTPKLGKVMPEWLRKFTEEENKK
ncbi:MAG TPA: cytochrome c nitrite reductase small subunit [Ignavibacteriaceae bacterium]|nr:cytochrome c nitrite reductase small subunit [Ignavibacteriaceae bacterium]